MKVVTDDKNYSAIASAIRAKLPSEGKLKPSEMAAAISSLPSGAEPNVEISTSEPLDTSVLWVKSGGVPSKITVDGDPDIVADSASQTLTFTGSYAVNASAAAVDGKIYVLGCSAIATHASNLDVRVFDPAAGTITLLSSAQTARSAAAAGSAAVGGVIYTAGGSTYKDYLSANSPYFDTIITFNTADQTYGTLSCRLPAALAKTNAVAYGGAVYVMGGVERVGDGFSNVSDVYRIDVGAGSVTAAGSMPSGFAPECCALVGGRICCIGTSTPLADKSNAVTASWVYDIESGRSTPAMPIDADVYGACACGCAGRAFAFCRDGSVLTIDPDSGACARCPSALPTATEGACCAELNGVVYVIGGYVPNSPAESFWRSPQRIVQSYTASPRLASGTMHIVLGIRGVHRTAEIMRSDAFGVSAPVAAVRLGDAGGVPRNADAFVYDGGWKRI